MHKGDFPKWFRDRGYLHLTGRQTTQGRNANLLFRKIQNANFVKSYAFFPLIHTSIEERRYKRKTLEQLKPAHTYPDGGIIKSNAKSRPLHYANHTDALIFGYYSSVLGEEYEKHIKKISGLSECIVGYRKHPIVGEFKHDGTPRNKGTAHFAFEAFEEIKRRAVGEGCIVLKFDIEKFFSSIDHKLLREAWANLLGMQRLEKDHYNVFKAAIRMHYVLLDDLRLYQVAKGRRAGFDEKRLAHIRKSGVEAFYESPQELRKAIKEGDIKVYKSPFTKPNASKRVKGEKWYPMGIPQGLPISSMLANIYLLDFDKLVYIHLVKAKGCYYRRYSDDLIIICHPGDAKSVDDFVKESIGKSAVSISTQKTEKFFFKTGSWKSKHERLTSIKQSDNCSVIGTPFTFLGFEFYGYQTLIKSTNLAKFYRRMIYAIKRKAIRAIKIAEKSGESPALFHNQIRKLYLSRDLRKTKTSRRYKQLKLNSARTHYEYDVKVKSKPLRSNYLSYIRRVASILKSQKGMERQLKKHRLLYQAAVRKHFKQRLNL